MPTTFYENQVDGWPTLQRTFLTQKMITILISQTWLKSSLILPS